MKLALGTVQFGLDYGVSTANGKTPYDEVEKILEFAELMELEVLDTAIDYGESEEVLGKAMSKNSCFKIITKVPGTNKEIINIEDIQKLENDLKNSLKKLKVKSLYGVMIHNVADVFKQNGNLLYEKLVDMKEKGLIKKIGFSVYDVKEINKIIDTYNFDIIQLPINVLDQRIIKSGYLKVLKKLGVDIYVRSVFLQGLLLMNHENLPIKFNTIKPKLMDYQQLLKNHNMSLVDGALDFIKNVKEIDYVVVGVNNLNQLNDLKESFDKRNDFIDIDYTSFASDNLEIIDPRHWTK